MKNKFILRRVIVLLDAISGFLGVSGGAVVINALVTGVVRADAIAVASMLLFAAIAIFGAATWFAIEAGLD